MPNMIKKKYFLLPLLPLLALLAISNCGSGAQESHAYLLLYAFDAEGNLLSQSMQVSSTDTILGRPVMSGMLEGKDIVLAEVGEGLINAAMTMQKLIDTYHPKAVIFSGIAGAIDTLVHIGDIVVCRRWITHDYGYLGPDSLVPQFTEVYSPNTGRVNAVRFFDVDSLLYEKARSIKRSELELDSIDDRKPNLLVGGTGVSGNTFIDNKQKRLWLNNTYGALVVDMESSAIAQTCFVNDVPFIIFRSASDLAGGSDNENAREQIKQFFQVAADNSSQVVLKYLTLLD